MGQQRNLVKFQMDRFQVLHLTRNKATQLLRLLPEWLGAALQHGTWDLGKARWAGASDVS